MTKTLLPVSFAAFACVACVLFAAPVASQAAAPDKYQVTGTVTAVTDSTITVLKGKENFEMARDASTKVSGGELKAGAKVTVQYKISAASVEVKPEKVEGAKGKKSGKGAASPAPGVTTGSTPQQPAAPAPATKPAGR